MIDSSQWQQALAHFDSAVSLSGAQLEAWLKDLDDKSPTVSPLVKKLLRARERVETKDFLANLPRTDVAQRYAGAINARVGPFILIETLGHGGMGSVWRARYAEATLKREVAVKLPALGRNPESMSALRERFSRERDFLAQLEHSNIARLYDAGVSDGGQPYLALEYVRGLPIDCYCDKQRLDVKGRITLFLQIVDAVEYAHRQLVLHRDIKPSNILIDTSGVAKLLDFGVAKLLLTQRFDGLPVSTQAQQSESLLTEVSGAAITLSYAAPEQILGETLTTATDVYSLGVTLFRLLCGTSPYQPKRDTRGALEDEILHSEARLASSADFDQACVYARNTTAPTLKRALFGELDWILAKALKKKAVERYPTASALADDLRRHLNQEPIRARPDSIWYRADRLYARNKIAVIASIVGLAVIVSTAGIALWQANIARANALRAAKESIRANAAQKFFVGIFSNADPEQRKNISSVDRQIIDRALASAQSDLSTDPDTLILVLKQIGEIYYRQGSFDKYLTVQKKRVALVESRAATPIDDFVEAQVGLGQALIGSTVAAERDEALPRLLIAQKLALEKNASSAVLIQAMAQVASRQLTTGKRRDARETAIAALARAKRTLPNPHPMLSLAFDADALTATRVGEFETARQSYKQAIAIDETGQGRGKLDQFITRNSLARLEYESGRYADAKAAALEAIAFAQSQLGPSEANLQSAKTTAIYATDKLGDFALAKAMFAQLLHTELDSKDAHVSGWAMFTRGHLALARDEFSNASTDISRAAVVLAPFENNWRAALRFAEAELSLKLGRTQEALGLLKASAEVAKKTVGTDTSEFSKLSELLGVAFARTGDMQSARSAFEEACGYRLSYLNDAHPERIRCTAYQLLAVEGSDALSARVLLRQNLARLRLSQTEKNRLVISLINAIAWRNSPSFGSQSLATFPILN